MRRNESEIVEEKGLEFRSFFRKSTGPEIFQDSKFEHPVLCAKHQTPVYDALIQHNHFYCSQGGHYITLDKMRIIIYTLPAKDPQDEGIMVT